MGSQARNASGLIHFQVRITTLAFAALLCAQQACRSDDAFTASILSAIELRCRTLEAFELQFEYEYPRVLKMAGTVSRSGKQWLIDVEQSGFAHDVESFREPTRKINWSDGSGWHVCAFEDVRSELPTFAGRRKTAGNDFGTFSPLHALGIVLNDGDIAKTAAETLAGDPMKSSRTLRGGSMELICERIRPGDAGEQDERRRCTLRFSPMPAMRMESCEISFGPVDSKKNNFVKRWTVEEFGDVDGVWYPKRCRYQEVSRKEAATLVVHRFSLSPKIDLSRVRSFETNPDVTFRDDITGKSRLSRKARLRQQQQATAAVDQAKEQKKRLDRPTRAVDARPKTSDWPNWTPWAVGVAALVAALLIWRKNR